MGEARDPPRDRGSWCLSLPFASCLRGIVPTSRLTPASSLYLSVTDLIPHFFPLVLRLTRAQPTLLSFLTPPSSLISPEPIMSYLFLMTKFWTNHFGNTECQALKQMAYRLKTHPGMPSVPSIKDRGNVFGHAAGCFCSSFPSEMECDVQPEGANTTVPFGKAAFLLSTTLKDKAHRTCETSGLRREWGCCVARVYNEH